MDLARSSLVFSLALLFDFFLKIFRPLLGLSLAQQSNLLWLLRLRLTFHHYWLKLVTIWLLFD